MDIFRFKRFEVINERSAMKVNTDGVLLGAAMSIKPQDRILLDVGTGTGTIALMAAQRVAGLADRSFAGAQDDNKTAHDGNVIAHDGNVIAHDDYGIAHDDVRDVQDDSQHVKDAVGVILNEVKNLCHIHAVDIDEPSATEAAANFRNSPWSSILHAHNSSLDEFADQNHDYFDLIFSNPPYFDNSLQAPQQRRNAARHTSTGLSYREILEFAADRLTEYGRVAMVLPADTEHDLTRHARMNGLHLYKITRVRTVPRKAPSRIIVEFSRHRQAHPDDTILTIQNEGQYTQEYLSLTKDFYLFA